MVKYSEFIVIADGWIKYRGSFKSCQAWCRNHAWVHDAIKELIIVKVVANGKEI